MTGPRKPIVITLTLDKQTHHFLTSLRKKYFPPHRNHLEAHVTLFHAIPAHRYHEVSQEIQTICSRTAPWEVFVSEPRRMGNSGVMVSVRDRRQSIEWLHRKLLKFLEDGIKEDRDRLTEQDKKHWGKVAHVTIQNKVEKEEEVFKCLDEVQELFEGMQGDHDKVGQKVGEAIGLELYVLSVLRSGHWQRGRLLMVQMGVQGRALGLDQAVLL